MRGRNSMPSCLTSMVRGSILTAAAPSSQTTAGDGSGLVGPETPGPAYLILLRSLFWAAPSAQVTLPVTAAPPTGVQSRSTARQNLMTEDFTPPSWTLQGGSRIELDFPVRPAEKHLPGLPPLAGRDLHQRLPGRLLRRLAEPETRLVRRPVGLPLVALHAGEDAVFPRRGASAAARGHVVDRELFRPRLEAAILASVAVTLEEVLARKDDGASPRALVGRQDDDLRRHERQARRADDRVAEAQLLPARVVPGCQVMGRERPRFEDERGSLGHETNRLLDRRRPDRHPAPVEDEGRALKQGIAVHDLLFTIGPETKRNADERRPTPGG